MPNPADLLARATPEMLEELADLVERESLVASAGLLPRELLLLAALARAVAKAERESNGDPWVARHSTIGRGFRIHNDKGLGQHPTLSAALASLLTPEDTDA